MMAEKFDFKKVLFACGFTLICAAINFGGAKFAAVVHIPLYLDSILTISVVALYGFVPGIVCAVLSNMAMVVFMGSSPLFTFCHLTTAILAFLTFWYFKKHYPKDSEQVLNAFLWAGFFAAISNAILGNIIADVVYGALTGRPQADVVAQAMFTAVPNRMFCIYISGFIQNLTDKMLSAGLSFIVFNKIKKWI